MVTIPMCQQHLQLLPGKAVFWQEEKILILADLHLGKAATFRAAGIPVPEGSMEADLLHLEQLLDQHQAERCIIVGDLVHHHSGLTDHTLQAMEKTICKGRLPVDLVAGNHDRALISAFKKDRVRDWPIQLHGEKLLIPPFAFIHHPVVIPGYYSLCGHLHPKVAVKLGRNQQFYPCFIFGSQFAVLPA
ncbi:MAG: ligase-associated DNA damage response endonuclease PdeM, partial [Parachlamydia sp.]|nr:ligase-associated DNA damage response endonuclease PdeM [Parachlamydia sp.]